MRCRAAPDDLRAARQLQKYFESFARRKDSGTGKLAALSANGKTGGGAERRLNARLLKTSKQARRRIQTSGAPYLMQMIKNDGDLALSDGTPVVLTRKKMKNLRLRVTQDGKVLMSAPRWVPAAQLRRFLEQRDSWALARLGELAPAKAETVGDGMKLVILGGEATLQLAEGRGDPVFANGVLTLFLKKGQNAQKALDVWWRGAAKEYFTAAARRVYPYFEQNGVPFPEIVVKKQRSLWGSCAAANKRINLNFYLFKAPPECVEYVAAHELAHFLSLGHDAEFYRRLSAALPDFERRKKLLRDTVIGRYGR